MKRYKVTIPEPCHADWDQMTPNERGRFCKHCSKTVVDFNPMSEEEMQAFVHAHKDEGFCGSFRNDQLDQPVEELIIKSIPRKLTAMEAFTVAIALAFGTGFSSCKSWRTAGPPNVKHLQGGLEQHLNSIHDHCPDGFPTAGVPIVVEDTLPPVKDSLVVDTAILEDQPLNGMVYFDVNKHKLKPTERRKINQLLATINRYPKRTIAIYGHTDNTGGQGLNQRLSLQRAESVKAFLLEEGVKNNMVVKGFGFDQPSGNNSTLIGRNRNRRVEIKWEE